MPAKEYLGWLRHYRVEPWGNREAGERSYLSALFTGQIDPTQVGPDDFIVKAETQREREEREEWEQQAAEFESEARKRRAKKGK